ncbi:PTS sugar transporter subunit IIB [Floccifex sp.]|uniref:PTS sugar transporter subunit IIB n=1 Tax=Floccifex sp. TaxID=2815810 RepID=UPI003F08A896
MKKVLVVCGNGIASSSIMVAALNDYLQEQGLFAEVDKASLIDLCGEAGAARINSYDLLVSSTKIDNPSVTIPVIIGVGLLTGIGEDEVLESIKKELLK